MTPGARVAAAIDVLDVIATGASAEKTLTTWARKNRYAGSGDRAAIRDLVFTGLRQKRSLGWLGQGDSGRALMIGLARASGQDPETLFTGEGYAPSRLSDDESKPPPPLSNAPPDVQCDCPAWLWPRITADLGDEAEPVLRQLQNRAPVYLRVNSAKTTREAAIEMLSGDEIECRPHDMGKTCLEVVRNPRRIKSSRAYREGLVELQDAASQAVVDCILAVTGPGRVLDYCAGGGGKALALAAGGAGRVWAHDISPERMSDIPERAKRAGADIVVDLAPKGPFDTVVCDAPCSGSGAWRRQPEAKWRLTTDRLEHLLRTQDDILDRASQLVDQNGHLVYATCSIIRDENDARAEGFVARNPGWTTVFSRNFSPLLGGDGFHVTIFQRTAQI
ncbi:MAG: RsmB/NOP family class I SAM-dependent RNA methyltransferase [Silicimonas sp.]|nr:RsmB/NOP family class I SAM-dependent RNA methyltransferase [Silicimonas sp.]